MYAQKSKHIISVKKSYSLTKYRTFDVCLNISCCYYILYSAMYRISVIQYSRISCLNMCAWIQAKSVFCMVMFETRFCQTARGKVMTIALTDRKFSSHFFFLYSSKNRSSQRDCSVTHTHTKKKRELQRRKRKKNTSLRRHGDGAKDLVSPSFVFLVLRRICIPSPDQVPQERHKVNLWISIVCICVCICVCVRTYVCVVISSSLFYEYMNIFNGHLSQGRFPDDKFPGKGTIYSPAVHSYFQPCFLCILSPRKIRTTASVFDYGYFKTKFIFLPLRLRMYTCSGRARQGYVHRNHFYHNHRKATFFCNIYQFVFFFL